jgi:hypothetical protein
VLSFFFFLAMLVGFAVRSHFGYLILAAAFLVLHIFSLTGLWMLRTKSISIFQNGLEFRRRFIPWSDLQSGDFPAKKDLSALGNDRPAPSVPDRRPRNHFLAAAEINSKFISKRADDEKKTFQAFRGCLFPIYGGSHDR